MKDRLEKIVLLPFTAGCISEASIPVVRIQHTSRYKQGTNSAPTGSGKHEEEKKDEDEGNLVDAASLSGQNWKTTLPRFQKLLKNLSLLCVYKDEEEPEMGMDIGLPSDVKHVSHIGLDGCARSMFSKGMTEEELINLHSFPVTEAHTDTIHPNSLCLFEDDSVTKI